MGVPHDPEEVVAIVDANDNIVGRGKRKKVHSSLGYLPHRHVQVLVVNNINQILLQFRTDPHDSAFTFLDYSAGGHFPYSDDYVDGAVRETEEELGIKSAKKNFRFMFKKRLFSGDGNSDHYMFVALFELRGDYKIEDIEPDPEEVLSVRYYSAKEIKRLIARQKLLRNVAYMLSEYMRVRNL